MGTYQLYMSLRSPFARRVRLLLEELGVNYETQIVDVFKTPPQYLNVNPLARVPSLKLPNGEFLIDSNVILKYLSEKYFDHPLFQNRGGRNNYFANISGLSVGIMEWTVTWFLESLKPKAQQDTEIMIEAEHAITRTFSYLNTEIQSKIDLRSVSKLDNLGYWDLDLGAAIGYAQFRMKQIDFTRYPYLIQYFELLMKRESFQKTVPIT